MNLNKNLWNSKEIDCSRWDKTTVFSETEQEGREEKGEREGIETEEQVAQEEE